MNRGASPTRRAAVIGVISISDLQAMGMTYRVGTTRRR
jgi:hypothetical protein